MFFRRIGKNNLLILQKITLKAPIVSLAVDFQQNIMYKGLNAVI